VGPICLVIGDDLKDSDLLNHPTIITNGIEIKHFPNITFPEEWMAVNNNLKTTDGRNLNKKFQWHKLHLFNTWFRKWNYVFYIDCGMTIFSSIQPILNERKRDILLAHSDAYPSYEWELFVQFEKTEPYFTKLLNNYTVNIDYFQTGIMLFDTSIIDDNTFSNLYSLALEFPNTRTNEQAIIALYFTNVDSAWEPIIIQNKDTHFYDSSSRNHSFKYIMLKMNL
jgi:hypothetical protein